MGQGLQIIKPTEGINTDRANKYMKSTQVRFALNMERSINNVRGGLGTNDMMHTPPPANILIDYTQPPGNNLKIGQYKRGGEMYVWVYNDLAHHHIYRINRNNTVQMVLLDPLLNFSKERRYRIRHAHLYINHQAQFETGSRIFRKYLTWTEGSNWQGHLDVETSIATNSFSIPYFDTPDRTELWQLPTRPSLVCPYGDFDPASVDTTKQNLLRDKPWEFRIKYIYTDGRQTSWGPISEMFLLNTSPCLSQSQGQPRCISLRLDAGGPLVEKIVLAYRNCVGGLTNDQDPEWFESEIIDKYDNCLEADTPFYERNIREELDYDSATNTIGWKFCAEGTCIPIARTETNRNYIDIPKFSYCLAPMENKVALANNIWGDDPVNCEEVAEIDFDTVERQQAQTCTPEYCKVRVGVVVHQVLKTSSNTNQPLHIKEKIATDDQLEGAVRYFGGVNADPDQDHDPKLFSQQLADTSKEAGFLVYVEGSNAQARTVQYRNTGGVLTVDDCDDFNTDDVRDTVANDMSLGKYYFIQIAEFTVVKGTKGFIRVASHLHKPEESGIRNTSTTVYGVLKEGMTYTPTMHLLTTNCYIGRQELYFDTCGVTELDLTAQPIIIADLTWAAHASWAWCGYFRDRNKMPISRAELNLVSVDYAPRITSTITDHNGFYWITVGHDEGERVDPELRLMTEGGTNVAGETCQKVIGGIIHPPGDKTNGLLQRDAFLNNIPETATYETDYMDLLNVVVADVNGTGLAGVVVACEGCKAATTGPDGHCTIMVRHDMEGTYPSFDPRRVVIMQNNICFLTVTGCNPCLPKKDITLPECFHSLDPNQPLSYTVDFSADGLESPITEMGYHPGGVYPLAIKLSDGAGRETAAEKIKTVTLPSIQGKQAYSFSDIRWHLNGFKAPPEYKRLSILIGQNRAFGDFTSWIADKVTFVDGSGTETVTEGAAKVLLSIRSLYDSANVYAFGTNVRYTWQPGDKVEIVANADGSIFSDVLQFYVEADYNNLDAELAEGEQRFNQLVIGYNYRLADLQPGCQIKLIREIVCEPQEQYFECCQTVELVEGVPQVTTGIISGWDTYLVHRSIRYDDITHDFPFPFLHHSPTDYWGDHCVSRGRMSVTNPYAKRLQHGLEFRLSNSFLENSNYNGLNDFELPPKTFSGEQRGDIVFMISREQVFMMVCERDNFICNSATEFVRVAANGMVTALPPDSIVSDAQSKISGNYGCRYEDGDGVVVGDGWVFWVDQVNKLPVIHNWQEAQDATQNPEGSQTAGYWKSKLYALGDKLITAGYDNITKNVMVTFFDPAYGYVHNDWGFVYAANETIAFCIIDRRWPTTYSFTPEGYGCFEDNDEGDIFITFKQAKPYMHRSMKNTVYNEFYGVRCDNVFEPVFNENPGKVKIFQAMQQQSDMSWWSDRILSSLGHTSILPPAFVNKFTEGKFDCHFLCADNRGGGLYNGPQLRGNWLQVRFIRDNSTNNIWKSTDPSKQALYGELDAIIGRYAYSEQSQYNVNNQP